MIRKKETILPNTKSEKELANNFLTFFKGKIEKIRDSFPAKVESVCEVQPNPNLIRLSEFEPATLEEITSIAKSYGIKCSPDDPVCASLLSSNVDTFAPYWMEIVIYPWKLEAWKV